MHKYLYIIIFCTIIFLSILASIFMTRNGGQGLEKMADIFDSDIFQDIHCFNKCLETCMVEMVPELTDDQKINCEQECGVRCSGDVPIFRI